MIEFRKGNEEEVRAKRQGMSERLNGQFDWRLFLQKYGTITAFVIICAFFTVLQIVFSFNNVVIVMRQILYDCYCCVRG